MSYEEDLTNISEQVDQQFNRVLGQLDKLKQVRSSKTQNSDQKQHAVENLTDRLQKHFTTNEGQRGLGVDEIDSFKQDIQDIKQSLEERMEETLKATSPSQRR